MLPLSQIFDTRARLIATPFFALVALAIMQAIPTLAYAQTSVIQHDNGLITDVRLALDDSEPAISKTISATELLDITLAYAQSHMANDSTDYRSEYQAGRLDPKLSFKRCDQTLTFQPQKQRGRSGNLLIKLTCQDPSPWSLFVPLKVSAWQTVVTLQRNINRNEVLSRDDLVLREIELTNSNTPYLTQMDEALGQITTHSIKSGSPLQARQLQQPRWVHRGDQVMIIASANGVSARMTGIAMADGKKNQQINVRNQQSKRIIRAKVIAPGKVATVM